MRLFLVRHGETDWNIESRFQGWADIPLSSRGEEQARVLADMIKGYHLDAAYCSDLQRASRTAEILLEGRGIKPVKLEELREMDIGEMDGLPEPEVKERFPDVLRAWRTNPADVVMPGGETLRQVQERVWRVVQSIVEKHRDENVLLVGHHTVNKALICRVLYIPLKYSQILRQPPCALSVIDFLQDRHYIRAVNLNWRERTNVWIDLDEETKERVWSAKGLIFDLDGVILDSMKHYAAAWRGALAEWGIIPPEIELYRRESEEAETSVRYFFQQAGKEADQATIDAVVKRMGELYRSYPGISLRPETIAVIKKLKGNGLRLGLVTGSRRRDVERLLTSEQLSIFDVVICGDEVHNSKPNPEPFVMAVERLGLPAERVLVIENAPYGIRAAKAAGLLTAAVPTTLPPEELYEADLILDSLERLPGWLGIA